MLEFLTHANLLARHAIPPGFQVHAEMTDRWDDQSAPASCADFIDSPYQVIRDRRQIAGVLQRVLDSLRSLRMTARRGARTEDTRLLRIDTARDCILLRELFNDASHSQLLLDGHANITARHNEIPILFTVKVSGSGSFDGIPCYMAPLPDWILSAQMRDSFRIHLPAALGARLCFRVAGVGPIEASVLDISESGLSALVPAGLTRAVSANERFGDASLRTHDGIISPLGITLRYVGSALGGPQRMGVSLDVPTESQRQNLRRLILRHQPFHATAG